MYLFQFFKFFVGRNEKGQLGHGDEVRRDTPLVIEAIKDEVIVGAACGRNHSLLLSGKSSPLMLTVLFHSLQNPPI